MARLRPALIALLPTASLLVAPAADAAPRSARVHLQAPVRIDNPTATDLDDIETYGSNALWSDSFEIPYGTLEKEIRKEMVAVLAKYIPAGKQVETCTDPCPDVTWQIFYTPSFAFTDENNVTLKQIGASGNNEVRAAVKFRAKAGLTGHVWAEAMVPKPMPVGFIMEKEEVTVPFDLFVEVEVSASVDVTLWPDLAAEDIVLDAKIVDKSSNITIDGTAAKIGAEVGILLGTTPLGLASGGPLAFATLLAVIGDEAADAAEAEIEGKMNAAIEKHFNESLGTAQDAAKEMLTMAVASANAKKDKALSTKLPGVNKSIDELRSSLGGSIEVHTVTPSSGIALSGVLRMTPSKGSAAMSGKVRVPARKCIYIQMMGGTIPAGYEQVNKQLESKVGQSCSSAMSGISVQPHAYLGANPRTALGAAADNRSSWKGNMGNVSLTGTLTDGGSYYECGYSVTAMPNTAIMEMRVRKGTSSLAIQKEDSRFFVQKAGPTTLVLDHLFKPTTSAVVGGTNTCTGGTGGGPRWTPSKVKELADMLAGCPECGKVIHKKDMTIYELSNTAKVKNSALGKEVAAEIARSGKGKARSRAGMRGRARTRVAPTKTTSPATKASKLPGMNKAIPGG